MKLIDKIAECQGQLATGKANDVHGKAAGPGNAATGKKPKCFIQVNISGEKSKHGFKPEDALSACGYAISKRLDIVGFMGMGPEPADNEKEANSAKAEAEGMAKIKADSMAKIKAEGMAKIKADSMAKSKEAFMLLNSIRNDAEKEFNRKFLISAGMTSDYKIAIGCGADIVRIGRAIFG